jgi:ABC-type Na+ efflux pump permease subunit
MSRFFPEWRDVATVFAKERRDALRDRRTMLTVLIVSLVVGPLTLFMMAQFIGSLVEESKEKLVRVEGLAQAPELANFMLRNGVKIEAAPAGYEEAIRRGRLSIAVIRVPADFADKFAALDGSPEAMAAGFALFGKSFQEMIPLLKDGGGGLELFAGAFGMFH